MPCGCSMGESSGRWSNQLQPRESLAIAAPVAGEQGDPLHQGMGADQEIRQHGLARTASGPVFGVGASGQEGGFAGDGTVRCPVSTT